MWRRFTVSMAAFLSVSMGATRVGAEPFRNLDFEASEVFQTSPSAIAPWTAHIGSEYDPGGVPLNTIALDSANLTLIDASNRGWQQIEGRYSLLLQGGWWETSMTEWGYRDASISQTGDVPADAQSIRMLVRVWPGSLWTVSLDGNNVPMFPLKGFGGDTWEYGGDVRSYAGLTSRLVLSTSANWENSTLFDAIAFSAEPVPEPSSIVLAAVGLAGLLACRRKRRHVHHGGLDCPVIGAAFGHGTRSGNSRNSPVSPANSA
ncbi:MAG: PEP-CTERM sorting domain-containing protein [Pirellulales bacterium]